MVPSWLEGKIQNYLSYWLMMIPMWAAALLRPWVIRRDEPDYDYSAGVYLVRLNMGEYSAGYPINGVSYDDCQVRLGRGSPGEATPLTCVCNRAFQPAELADLARRIRSGELPDVGAVGAARARALVAARGVV